MTNEKMPKNAQIFSCEHCDFTCSKESNYNIHILTLKHKIRTNTNFDEEKKFQKVPDDNKEYKCHCGKSYSHRQSLSVHKKTCTYRPQSAIEKIEQPAKCRGLKKHPQIIQLSNLSNHITHVIFCLFVAARV